MDLASVMNNPLLSESSEVMQLASGKAIQVLRFGELDYQVTQSAMQSFALQRAENELDMVWMLQHPQLYTQGTACTQEPLLASDIPTFKSDRGGQITFHGPGQLVLYPMLKLKEHAIGVKTLVNRLEQSVINLLEEYAIVAERRDGAPGIYVNDSKIAALGLRIRNGTSYHGLSLNIDMDLSPFSNIDPCGYQGLQVVQMSELASVTRQDLPEVGEKLLEYFCEQF